MAASVGSVITLVICVASTFNYVHGQAAMYAVTVDYGWAQSTGERENEWEGGGYGTTGGGYGVTAGAYGATGMMGSTTVAGEVEPPEAEEMASSPSTTTTTTQAPTPKPKKKQRKRPKSRRRRPKNLKPKPKQKIKAKKIARKPAPTTSAPTLAPTLAPTTRAPTPAPTPAPTMAPVKKARKAAKKTAGAQGRQANAGYAASGGAAQSQQVKVVPHVYQQPVPTTTPAPATKSPLQYLYEPHSCPKMDVATWENEVVIYDNKNCAIIVRMNPRLRRPTVTFQAPYW